MRSILSINIFLFFISCNSEVQPTAPTESAAIENAYIVLCDFTTSVGSSTTKTREKLINDAKWVYKNIRNNSKVGFYPIKGETFSKAIVRFEKKIPVMKSIQDTMRYKAAEISRKNEFDSLITLAANDSLENRSCIINTIERFSGQLNNYQAEGIKNLYLVILSDMLEVCTSPVGRINLENGGFTNAEQLLAKFIANNSKLAKLENFKIIIIISNGKDESYGKLNNFWKGYFNKIGYDNLNDLDTERPSKL